MINPYSSATKNTFSDAQGRSSKIQKIMGMTLLGAFIIGGVGQSMARGRSIELQAMQSSQHTFLPSGQVIRMRAGVTQAVYTLIDTNGRERRIICPIFTNTDKVSRKCRVV